MLAPLVRASALAPHIDGVLSVDAAGIYKPSPRVYQLAVRRLRPRPAEIGFVSSNGWDAAGAAAFGFTTFWINRSDEPVERHAPEPDFIVGLASRAFCRSRRWALLWTGSAPRCRALRRSPRDAESSRR